MSPPQSHSLRQVFWLPALVCLALGFAFLTWVDPAWAQVEQVWVKTYDGPGANSDRVKALALDYRGNVIVTGTSMRESTAGNEDYCTIKYSPAGQELWVRRYGPNTDRNFEQATAIGVDGEGNILVTGSSRGPDPNKAYDYDYATIKYAPDGTELWVRRYGPDVQTDVATALAVDPQGNVYVTGYSYTGTSSGYDYVTLKYDKDGNLLKTATYDGGPDDRPVAMGLDGQGNVYITGKSNPTGGTRDYLTVKYNKDLEFQWAKRYDGGNDDTAVGLAVDAQGFAYVTGSSYVTTTVPFQVDLVTIKYEPTLGDQMWLARYHTTSQNTASAIKLDGQGFVYVTGYAAGTPGFNSEFLTVKYDAATGGQVWADRYHNGAAIYNQAYGLAVDYLGNAYVTGGSWGVSPVSDFGCVTVKYAPGPPAQRLWVARYGGPFPILTQGTVLAVDVRGHVYVGGTALTYTPPSNFDYLTLKYRQAGYPEGSVPLSLLLLD